MTRPLLRHPSHRSRIHKLLQQTRPGHSIKIGSDSRRWRERVTPTQVVASVWFKDPLKDSELVIVRVAVARVLARHPRADLTPEV